MKNDKYNNPNHYKNAKPSQPKRGQIWRPKDPAQNAVIVSLIQGDIIYLQYVPNLNVSFSMALPVFLRHYQFSHFSKKVHAQQLEPTIPFYA